MSQQWFTGEVTRSGLAVCKRKDLEQREDEAQETAHKIAAAVSAASFGLQVYVPFMQRYRRIGRRIIETTVPRFGAYIFLRFDRDDDPWPDLLRGHGPVTSHFRRILSGSDGVPIPVPDEAIDAVRAYKPTPIEEPEPIRYRPGQRIMHTMAGVRREAVFVEYCGNRPMIRMWIFGAERVAEASIDELEPLEQMT